MVGIHFSSAFRFIGSEFVVLKILKCVHVYAIMNFETIYILDIILDAVCWECITKTFIRIVFAHLYFTIITKHRTSNRIIQPIWFIVFEVLCGCRTICIVFVSQNYQNVLEDWVERGQKMKLHIFIHTHTCSTCPTSTAFTTHSIFEMFCNCSKWNKQILT